MYDLKARENLFFLVVKDKPKITVDAYPVVSESPLVVSDDCVKFFYKGKQVFWTYFLDKKNVSHIEVNPFLSREYYRLGNDNYEVIDLINYKFILANLTLVDRFSEYSHPHNPLLDV